MTFSKDKLDTCEPNKFCNLQTTFINVSNKISGQIMDSCKHVKHQEAFGRKGGTVPQHVLVKDYPDVINFFKSKVLSSQISKIIGTSVEPTPLIDPLSCTVVVYDRQGDTINWHYDNNIYNGRLITVNICIHHGYNTCSVFEYKTAEGHIKTIKLKQNEAIIFEGTKVFHRVSPTCDNEKRVVLSMLFTTDKFVSVFNKLYGKVKKLYFY